MPVCLTGAIKLIGRRWNVATLLEEVLKDKDYFLDSNGGITLSGGKPMMPVKFLKKLLPRLKSIGIHVNIESCGVFKREATKTLLPFINFINFDIKHMDSEARKKYTRRRVTRWFPGVFVIGNQDLSGL